MPDLGVGKNLVLWAYFFGGRPEDEVDLTITGPKGEVFSQTLRLDRAQAQLFRAGGKRVPAGGWAAGDYAGLVVLRRGDQELDRESLTLALQ